MEITGYLEEPADDPEMFDGVKQALLLAIRHYLRRGWITEEEVRGAIEEESG